jgi:hypothetical protein
MTSTVIVQGLAATNLLLGLILAVLSLILITLIIQRKQP